jgi:hypothetical protein
MEIRTKDNITSHARELLGLVVASQPKWTSQGPDERVAEIQALWYRIEQTLTEEYDAMRARETAVAKGKKHFVSDSSRSTKPQ